MSPRRHVDDLFTGAYDDDLSPIDEARFQAHLRACPDCSAAYQEFTATVDALRELPKAHMARVVHLPSTAPIAEKSRRPRISFGWLGAGLRRFPVTAVAGGVAVVLIVLALTHPGSPASSTASTSLVPAAGSAGDHGPAGTPVAAEVSACSQELVPVVGAALPAGFSKPVEAKSLSQPGAHLDLAASTLSVTPGQQVTVYAQLSEPLASAGAPGATSAASAIRAVRPCVSVGVGGSALQPLEPGSPIFGNSGSSGGTTGDNVPGATGAGSLVTFTVPAGLAPGTVLHVVATIPPGFDAPGSPALTATITLTTR
jgi:anti-sigma factor RsiW